MANIRSSVRTKSRKRSSSKRLSQPCWTRCSSRELSTPMLEFDDIQYILLTRVPALTGRYEFLSFHEPVQGRAWLEAIRDKVPSAKSVADTVNLEKRWVSVAFTWNGLRTLGVDEASLATFPEEFRQGMAARWQVLGDTGTNHPDNWVGGLAGPRLHAIAVLFARDAAERDKSAREHKE